MKLEDYNEYYIQGSDHYLIPKAVFIELYEEIANFREETKELESQLKGTTHCFDEEEHNRLQKENQQKEFIEYLVNEIKEHEKHDKKNNCEWQGYNFYQDVLSKHKEIIGDKE